MVSVCSALTLSLGALVAARESSLPIDQALSYLPSFSWINTGFEQSPLGGIGDGKAALTSLAAISSNASAEAAPWTYVPQCVPRGKEEPVCVFALHSFAKGRGISIITTPSNASAFIKQSIFKSGNVAFGANVDRTDIKEERDIPGAGRGMIARKALNRGDNVYTMSPILLIHPAADDLDAPVQNALFWQAARSLPKATQPLFWDLAAHEGDADPAADRVGTNAFAFEFYGLVYSVVNPEIARLNHDCRPNGVYFFDDLTMTQYVHAVRPVAPGEQLTISYTDASEPWTERQRHLKKNWGFGCSCSACTQHPRLTHESDQRLAEMEALSDRLADDNAAHPPQMSAAQAIDAAERLLALYELERYEAMIGEALVYVAMAYASAKNADKAKLYGRRAHLASMIEDGFYHPGVNTVRQLAEDPQSHWTWGIRVSSSKPKQTRAPKKPSSITQAPDPAATEEDDDDDED